MQSPLQALLDEVEARCDADAFTSLPAAASEGARVAASVPLMAEVAAVLQAANVQGCAADDEHVASCKQRGTEAFGRGQHRQAAQLFSEALRYIDESGAGAQLASRLYCNRALCLTKAQPPELQAALQDSSAAVACDPANPKAWYRRACAARALGHGAASPGPLQDARRALQLLREQAGATAEAAALVAALEAELAAAGGGGSGAEGAAAPAAECANGHATPAELRQAAAAAETAEGGEEERLAALVQAAGAQLAVQQSEEAGRFLAAAEQLAEGRDVLQEQPFAFALTKKGRRSACSACLATLDGMPAPYYCRRCPMPAYCSAACRAADPFHQPGGPECGRPWPALLPPEALAAVRLARRLAADRGSAAARQVAALGTHFEELDPAEVAPLAALAAVAHATWQAAAGPAGPEAVAGGLDAADVLAALCRLQINGLAVVPPERRGADDRLALALYPVASLLNHSCLPNAAARFEGGTLVVRALEPVAAGQPLLHCYGPQAGEATAAQRRRLLRQQYHFDCRCRACAAAGEAGGRLADAAPAGLRCPAGGGSRCEGAALPTCSVAAGLLHRYQLPAGSGACCACGARLSIERWQGEALPELQAAAEAHAAAAAALRQLDAQRPGGEAAAAAAQQAVRGLRQALRRRQHHLHPHSLLLGATHDELAHAWHLAGNHEAAAQHLRHSLATLRYAYPPRSTAAAFQQRQLAQALRLAAAAAAGGGGAAAAEALLAEARQAEEEARGVLDLHFGRQR